MKKILLFIIILIMISGCSLKRDNMENIKIYTTNYPIEYITKRLYGEHATIYSIYPNGVNIDDYKLTDKQIKDYGDSDLYIFNGLSKEKEYVEIMRKSNKNLKIIDTTLSMEYINGVEELWLDPSNFLMMAQNIKMGFKEYINNYYLNNDINNNYEKLKIEISNLDAKIKQIVENSDNKTIVASSNLFKYLEKYGLTVYTLDSETLTNKNISEIKNLINHGKINYIFIKENQNLNKTTQEIIDQTAVETLSWKILANITENQRTNGQNYFDLMNENLELLKNELYK